jgi:hypothetical protein
MPGLPAPHSMWGPGIHLYYKETNNNVKTPGDRDRKTIQIARGNSIFWAEYAMS